MTTKPMQVANIAFLLDRLAADTPPNQQIRELTQNALEAIRRRLKQDVVEGFVRWDIDWEHHRRTQQYKLCIVDNGDGMTPEQMSEYLNSLAVQGANETQSISQNFGVGAKITALYRNRYGLVYQSWRDGRGTMVKLHRDDRAGVYGLASFDLADGPHWTPKMKNTLRPRGIEDSGTKVTLMGAEDPENTCFPPEDVGSGMNWLVKYLTTRYFRLPESVKLQVRVLTRDDERWPTEEPASSEKTFNLQTIRGMKHLLDDYAKDKGTVHLATADAHWWLFDDPARASKDMSSRGGRTSIAGIVFQDEVYILRTPPSARRLLASFGILFGADHVALFIEPRENSGLEIRADTARSRLMVNGEDLDDANWWETWGTEFRTKIPGAIKDKIDEIMARTDRDPEGRTRERILERLKRIQALLKPSRYRRDPNGPLMAAGQVTGGSPQQDGRHLGGEHRAGGSGGRRGDDYLADLVESDGEPASDVTVRLREPEVKWVTLRDHTRSEDELEDQAAEIQGDPATGDLIKANADFRGYLDLLSYFNREFNPDGDEAIKLKIVDYVQEWIESQLVEAVMTVRNLANGRTWTTKELEQALSSYALTTVVMARFHVVEKVSRALGSEVSRRQAKAA